MNIEPDVLPVDTGIREPATSEPTEFTLVPEGREVVSGEGSTSQRPPTVVHEPVVELATKSYEPQEGTGDDVIAEAA